MPGPEDNIRPSGPVGPQPNAAPTQPTFGSLAGAPQPARQPQGSNAGTFGALGSAAQSPPPTPATPPSQPPNDATDPDQVKPLTQDDINQHLQEFARKQSPAQKEALEKSQGKVDQNDINASLSQFAHPNFSTATKPETYDETAPIVGAQKPGESTVDYLKRNVNEIWTQARAGLGETPEKQKAAWESMYGADNVKVRAGNIYVKPEGEDTFRKVDARQSTMIGDFLARNYLNAIPALINGAITGAASAAMPVTAARAFGGAGDFAARQAMQGGIDQFSSKPQITGSLSDQLGQTAQGMGISAAANIVVPKALEVASDTVKYLTPTSAVKWGLENFQRWSQGTGPVKYAKELAAKSLTDLEGFFNRIQNITRLDRFDQNGVPIGGKTLQETVSRNAMSALDTVADNYESQIGLVNDKAVQLATEQDKKVVPTNLAKQLKDELSRQGVDFNSEGRAIVPGQKGSTTTYVDSRPAGPGVYQNVGEASAKTPHYSSDYPGQGEIGINQAGSPGARPSVSYQDPSGNTNKPFFGNYSNGLRPAQQMANLYNRIMQAMPSNPGPNDLTTSAAQGGMELPQFLNELKAIRAERDFDGPIAVNDAKLAFGRLSHAAAEDRNDLFNHLFSGGDSSEAQSWKSTYESYQGAIGPIKEIQGVIRTDSDRAMLVDTLSKFSGPKKLGLIQAFKNALGEQSPEWNLLRGEIVYNTIDKSVDPITNVVNGKNMLRQLVTMKSQFADTLLSPEEQGGLKVLAANVEGISNTNGLLSPFQRNLVGNAVKEAVKFGPGGRTVLFLAKLFSGNKAVSDFIIDKGLIDAARQAQSKPEQMAILQQKSNFEKLISNMTVANVSRGGKMVTSYVASPAKIAASHAEAGQVMSQQAPPLADTASPDAQTVPDASAQPSQ